MIATCVETPGDTPGCGETRDTPCHAAFATANCGNCYYVSKTYPDGTTKSVYVQAVGTTQEWIKMELSPNAWQHLCPYVCEIGGACVVNATQCGDGGVSDQTGCEAPRTDLIIERVPCNDAAMTNQRRLYEYDYLDHLEEVRECMNAISFKRCVYLTREDVRAWCHREITYESLCLPDTLA
eukprot:Blabericola_migrator_1__7596@NODE_3882_length_1451_cov_7537_315751_g306_i1_p1_GENE_NODE_3882_length_1451_cov_7537_315751_g306_i1NODE_3882_length_1451_cov_7537_315751_g306_i1_p1_ORF_typecomplete_len212_score24_66Ceratoplatanin/PF07249_12/0_00092Ceratoplatanin/PF07249_12/2_9e03DUF2989/PF11207_8/0_058Asparaginase_C/PF17763_1/0_21_NODE_3882_length_1451_cov_7537_315751_g306_i18141356